MVSIQFLLYFPSNKEIFTKKNNTKIQSGIILPKDGTVKNVKHTDLLAINGLNNIMGQMIYLNIVNGNTVKFLY